MSNKENLNLIQVLRGVASLLVVFYHTSSNLISNFNSTFLGNIFFFGSSGVDVFFVLSGFIITWTSFKNLENPGKLGQFLLRRVVRIFPVYWIIITLFLLAQIIFPAYYRTHFDLSFLNLASSYLLLPGHVMINGVSWSLTYELFFYLLFALAFLIPNKKWAFALAMLYAVALIILYVSGYNILQAGNWTRLVLSPMNIEFFLGVLAAVVIPRISQKAALPFLWIGLILFVAGGAFIDMQQIELHPDLPLRVLVFGPASFFIITGIVKYELNKKIAVPQLMLRLGEASYTLYLLHLPVVVAFAKIISMFNIHNTAVLHLLIILLIVFICYASILFNKFVEKPMVTKLNAYSNKKIKPADDEKMSAGPRGQVKESYN